MLPELRRDGADLVVEVGTHSIRVRPPRPGVTDLFEVLLDNVAELFARTEDVAILRARHLAAAYDPELEAEEASKPATLRDLHLSFPGGPACAPIDVEELDLGSALLAAEGVVAFGLGEVTAGHRWCPACTKIAEQHRASRRQDVLTESPNCRGFTRPLSDGELLALQGLPLSSPDAEAVRPDLRALPDAAPLTLHCMVRYARGILHSACGGAYADTMRFKGDVEDYGRGEPPAGHCWCEACLEVASHPGSVTAQVAGLRADLRELRAQFSRPRRVIAAVKVSEERD